MSFFFRSLFARALVMLLFLIFLGTAILVLFQQTAGQPVQTVNLQYNLMLSVVLVFLPLAALAVVWALRFWGYVEKPWTVLVLAYVLPLAAVLIIQVRLWIASAALLEGGLTGSTFRSTWQPLYYLWQTFVLLFSGWFLFPGDSGAQLKVKGSALIRGVLTGLGLGLGGAFFSSILIHQFSLSGRQITTPQPQGLLLWTVLLFSITLSPYAIQRFYRTRLEPHWEKRWSGGLVMVLAAGLFAVVQARLLLLPVAFAAGFGFSVLYRRSGFWAAAAAHAVFNLVMFIVGWYLVS